MVEIYKNGSLEMVSALNYKFHFSEIKLNSFMTEAVII